MPITGEGLGPRWRSHILVIDSHPELRWDAYREWRKGALGLDIETSILHAFDRMKAVAYGLVLVPLIKADQVSTPDSFIGEVFDRWALEHAPGYQDRFAYYGPPEAVVTLRGKDLPLLTLSSLPSAREVQQSAESLDSLFQRMSGRFRARRQAEREARRRAREDIGS